MDDRKLNAGEPPAMARENGTARRLAGLLVAFALYAVLALGLHLGRGAAESGFGSFDDEPSHLVTGLMFRDYIAAGMPGSPRAFAENYYVHYPKVGIGQWPPVFYAFEAFWMLLFGESSFSLLALMSCFTAGLAVCVFAALRSTLPPVRAFLVGALVCSIPLVQRMSSVIMTEIPVALFCLLAALSFGRFLATERARHAMAFAAFSVLAILTKGNALALGLMPALAIPLSGRWHVLRRPALWLAGALVALCCAPWYWLTLSISAGTWAGGSTPTLDYAQRASVFYGLGLVTLAGFAVVLTATVGAVARPTDRGERCQWASLLGLMGAVLLFHVTVPSSIESRHLALVAAPWVLLAGRGIAVLAETRGPKELGLDRILPGLLVAAFFVERFDVPPKDNHGYTEAVAHIEAQAELADSRVLIASDSQGEGIFIAAGALAGERTKRVFLRGSKVLGSSTWMGDDYQATFATEEDMMAYLAEIPVGIVAVDLSTRRHQWFAHMDMLIALLETHPEHWEPVGVFDVFRDGVHHPAALHLYRQVGHEDLPARELDFQTLYNRNAVAAR